MRRILLYIILTTMSFCMPPEVSGFISGTSKDTNINLYDNKQNESGIIWDMPELNVDNYFDMFPEEVRQCFYLDGWTYEKSTESLGDIYYDGQKQIFGMTNFDTHTIYIDNRDEANKSILHEVGHRFQYEPYVNGFKSQEFKDLYEEHWAEWYTIYGGNINNYLTEKEAYAHCYEMYFLSDLDTETKQFIKHEFKLIAEHYQKMSN